MTVCLAIKCKNVEKDRETPSILLAADTQESGSLKRQITKLKIMRASGKWSLENRKSKGWQIAAAFAGDSLVADEALERIARFLYKKLPPEEKNPAIMLREYRREIGDIAYDTFQKHSARAREREVYDETDFEIFLGMADEEESTLLDTTYEGKTRFIEDFGVIGSGGESGGELLLREFFLKGKQRGEGSDLNEDAAASLAALVINVVGHVDLYVSGEPDMYFCHDLRVEVYPQDKYRKILDGSDSKWNLMRRVWQKMQEDNTFEGKLKQVLAK
jgi:hypothetical protein